MTEYEKIIWIDADMMVTGDLGELFRWPHMSCVRSRAPIPGEQDRYAFNSGLMVIEPNEADYRGAVAMIPRVVSDFQKNGQAVGDQNVLNAYYDHWPEEAEKHLPDGFNVFWGSIEGYVQKGYHIGGNSEKTVSVIHYTGGHKPWEKSNWFWMKSYIRALRHHKKWPSEESRNAMKQYMRYLKRVKKDA